MCIFFFQAEDGIRDLTVTGVQTCALPISRSAQHRALLLVRLVEDREATEHEAFRRERLAERAAREALGLGRDQPQRHDAPPLTRRPLDPWYGRRRQSWQALEGHARPRAPPGRDPRRA